MIKIDNEENTAICCMDLNNFDGRQKFNNLVVLEVEPLNDNIVIVKVLIPSDKINDEVEYKLL